MSRMQIPRLNSVLTGALLILVLVGAHQLRAEAPVSASEKAAIQKFETELKQVKTLLEPVMKDAQAAAAENPLAGLVYLKLICARMQRIKGEGLPLDLKEAWMSMTAAYAKMSELFGELPGQTF